MPLPRFVLERPLLSGRSLGSPSNYAPLSASRELSRTEATTEGSPMHAEGQQQGLLEGGAPGPQRDHVPPSPRLGRAGAKLAVLLLLALAALGGITVRRRLGLLGSPAEVKEDHRCMRLENNTEYHTEKPIFQLERTSSADQCCSACEKDKRCGAWTWGAKRDVVGLTDVCILRELKSDERPVRMTRPGVIAGLSQRAALQQQLDTVNTETRRHSVRRDHREGFGMRQRIWSSRKPLAVQPGENCPGRIDMAGVGSVSVVSSTWHAPDERAAIVEVLASNWVVPHMKGRAYFATRCAEGSYNRYEYSAIHLLGKRLRYTTDVSGAGCGCSASLYLVPMRTNPMSSQCADFYCDAGSSCGVPCEQITIQQANQHMWSSNLHLASDPKGIGATYHEADPANNTGLPGSDKYGQGASCIDTIVPFEVSASFHADDSGMLSRVEVTLSQSGRACPLVMDLKHYTAHGEDGLQKLSKVLAAGVTPVISYSGSKDMPWMVGAHLDGSGSCSSGDTEVCADSVRFYDFSVEDLDSPSSGNAATPAPAPSAMADSLVERAIGHMRFSASSWEADLPRELRNHAAATDTPLLGSSGTGGKLSLGALAGLVLEDETSVLGGIPEWEVIFNGLMNVRSSMDMRADVLGKKQKGEFVVGRRKGDWVALIHEPGYMRIFQKDVLFMRERRASYRKISNGSCTDIGHFPIVDTSVCENAAFALGYYDTTVDVYHEEHPRPEGCYLLAGYLFMSSHPANRGRGVVGHRQPICSSQPYRASDVASMKRITVDASAHATTTALSSITLETQPTTDTGRGAVSAEGAFQGLPKLFCMTVLSDLTTEVELVKVQFMRRAGIFACEEYAAFSEGLKVPLGRSKDHRLKTTELIESSASASGRRLRSGSSATRLSVERFLRVWDAVEQDGRYRKCEWTVKVDPDTVFFPGRLQAYLQKHTTPEGASLYVLNCEKPLALYGSLEVLSRRAAEAFLENKGSCQAQLPWQAWAEDYFLRHCLDRLGVNHVNGFSLLGDQRCKQSSCTDTSKVALNGFQGGSDWLHCWAQSVIQVSPDAATRQRK